MKIKSQSAKSSPTNAVNKSQLVTTSDIFYTMCIHTNQEKIKTKPLCRDVKKSKTQRIQLLQQSRRDGSTGRDAKHQTRQYQLLDRETTKNDTFSDASSRRDQKRRDEKETRRKARHTSEDALTRQKAHRSSEEHLRDTTATWSRREPFISATINKKLTSCQSCTILHTQQYSYTLKETHDQTPQDSQISESFNKNQTI
ncbi:hypothetical protein L2E82_37746 [Cichorium intybus]|uniref:Uncharacterized protein n=1 Tax=Cichorium intybus TaxID=13427 RepID=A0ACB9AG99_CICIN|nr:hypothetical protein L2E82_37746 [Cichorium intybus]